MSEKKVKNQEGPPEIEIIKLWCKSCSICVELCPKDVLAMEDGYPVVIDREACNRCQLCDMRCPDFAITVK
jgi:2-oxoglutarate ferredoxin oxidoreductase subunit delta